MTYREKFPLDQYVPRLPSQKRYCTYDLSNEYGIGYTRKGEKFLFDLDDYEYIKDFNWKIDKQGYAYCQIKKKGKLHLIRLHRIIADAPDGKLVDHINGDTLDNRRNNLRLVTIAQNGHNRSLSSKNKSGVTGVFWFEKRGKWLVNICNNNKTIYIGLYSNFDDAVKARYEAEDKYFGEYSRRRSLNKEA